MDIYLQAVIMGIVQGLTEFLPISSSGHLIIVPFLFGWDDPFITSLAFSVMLHIGTLAALLIYFAPDWVRLVPAGLRDDPGPLVPRRPRPQARLAAARREHPGRASPASCSTTSSRPRCGASGSSRSCSWSGPRSCGSPTAGAVGRRASADVTFPMAVGLGAAQALALIPGISRSGISISAAPLRRAWTAQSAARFSFLMATPIILGAALFELRKLVGGDAGVDVSVGPLVAGMLAVVRRRACWRSGSCSATCGGTR